MKLCRHTFSSVAAVLAIVSQGAIAQSDQSFAVPLSDPSRPAILDVSLIRGSISVTGYDGEEVIVAPRAAVQRRLDEPDADDVRAGAAGRDGLRRIPNTSMGFSVEEHDNTVEVHMTSMSSGGVEISVPRRTSVRAGTATNGDVTIEGVVGEHELRNVNGAIIATDIGGSVVANAANGSMRISFAEITPDVAMSFTTFNGEIDVTFPQDLAADLHMSTNRGEILTDFDVELQQQQPVVERDDDAGRYRVSVNQEVVAKVGGGGPEIRFKSFNGDILIRKR